MKHFPLNCFFLAVPNVLLNDALILERKLFNSIVSFSYGASKQIILNKKSAVERKNIYNHLK